MNERELTMWCGTWSALVSERVMNMNVFTKEWFKAAGIRAVRTIAQTAIAMIGTTAVMSEVNWIAVASASVLAGILSILTSLAGLPEVHDNPAG